jgi:hypothetical protein
VTRAGPKDAHLSVVKCRLAASPYFSNGLRGLVASILELSCTRAYVTDRRPPTGDSLSFRAQWA